VQVNKKINENEDESLSSISDNEGRNYNNMGYENNIMNLFRNPTLEKESYEINKITREFNKLNSDENFMNDKSDQSSFMDDEFDYYDDNDHYCAEEYIDISDDSDSQFYLKEGDHIKDNTHIETKINHVNNIPHHYTNMSYNINEIYSKFFFVKSAMRRYPKIKISVINLYTKCVNKH
jgi:hypothetical protein